MPDLNERAQLLVGLAERARREGLLALDDEVSKIDDEYVKKGLQLIVDGTDADMVAEVLEIEIEAMAGRHNVMGKVFKDAGGFSPTIGIIGTVMGLIHVLENLDNPETLGPAISGAFIATLYGVAIGQRHLPAHGEPPRRPVQGRGRAADAHARGHPRHPGRRQPAHPGREAPVLHPARPAQRGRRGRRRCRRAGGRRRPGRGRGRLMSARGGRGRGRRRRGGHGHDGEHENDERWLLTYADMITLLMALFMVLFSISSVNTSKFESLQRAMQDAFSGKILSGGESIQQTGAQTDAQRPAATPPIPAIQAITQQLSAAKQSKAAAKENEDFKSLKQQIDAYAKDHGLSDKLETTVARRGLVIRLLTDNVLFNSGSATLNPAATPLLDRISSLLRTEFDHPIVVEGHTDDQRIASSQFPSNWELSAARATAVVRFLIRDHVAPGRLAASGYGANHPLTSNASADGRARNRRVEIVLTRQN